MATRHENCSRCWCSLFFYYYYLNLLSVKVYCINNIAFIVWMFKRKKNDLFVKFGSKSVWSGTFCTICLRCYCWCWCFFSLPHSLIEMYFSTFPTLVFHLSKRNVRVCVSFPFVKVPEMS